MERQFTASLNKQMSDGMASKNGKDTLLATIQSTSPFFNATQHVEKESM